MSRIFIVPLADWLLELETLGLFTDGEEVLLWDLCTRTMAPTAITIRTITVTSKPDLRIKSPLCCVVYSLKFCSAVENLIANFNDVIQRDNLFVYLPSSSGTILGFSYVEV